ncbi:MAG: hypothetical protein JST61_04395 [Acidobacteria bacterium]|nr:hypothetical protein [Acidobacteriota bacterium]
MKTRMTTAALFAFAALPLAAQTTGVSNPDPVTIDATSADASSAAPAASPAKPSAAKAATEDVYGAYVPYKGPGAVAVSAPQAVPADVDSQIVTSVPETIGEINEGTLLRVRMREQISTSTTEPGARFTGEIMEPVMNNGQVIIPIGSVLEGQVTEVHSGRRISGAASLHLEPRTVTLPDGTVYTIHAQLIDTTLSSFNVDREGTLKRRDRARETLAVAALTTGSGAVAGAMLGGGVGAVVGAGIGAGATTVMWLKQERQATLVKDSRLVFSLTTPLILKPIHSASIDRRDAGAGSPSRSGVTE